MIDPQIAGLAIIALIVILVVPLIIGTLVEIRFPFYRGDNLLKSVQSSYRVGITVLFVIITGLFVLGVTCVIIYTAIYATLHGGL